MVQIVQSFTRVACACPELRVADCTFNADKVIDALEDAASKGAAIIAFPELCITSYSCGDLFLQNQLQHDAVCALERIADATASLKILACVGLPVGVGNALYNAAALVAGGEVLALVPKSYLPNYADYYELRHFRGAPAGDEASGTTDGCAYLSERFPAVPFGTRIIVRDRVDPRIAVAVEICEDLWVPEPPSIRHALAGATIIINLSASIEGIGKWRFRQELVSHQSRKLNAAYLYAGAAKEESTTDVIYAGHSLIAENGVMLAESRRFQDRVTLADVDVELLIHERQRTTSFGLCEAAVLGAGARDYRIIDVDLQGNGKGEGVLRPISRYPFVPEDPALRGETCEEALVLQSQGLAKRLTHTGAKCTVLGISGGLDSTLALLVVLEAWRILGKGPEHVVAVTLPCFGTSGRTKDNAVLLAEELGVTLRVVSIEAAVTGHLKDIGHDAGTFDAAFENAQARERTQVLMDMANMEGGLVVGTGDLSELALGWATYNGDQMSMYGVNATIPKTLVKAVVAHYADTAAAKRPHLAEVLRDILATPISPELLPPKDGVVSQITEDTVGPYELHDFFIYNAIRNGFSPKKVLFLGVHAFNGIYEEATVAAWLRVFYRRFFAQQYKRSSMPDGGKAGPISLSPRGEWRMPSDAVCTAWEKELLQ